MPRKVMPTDAENEESWNMPTGGTDASGWESSVGAGSQATAAHLKQTKKAWVLNTPLRTIDTSKKSSKSGSSKLDKMRTPRHSLSLFGTRGTPGTELSTPEHDDNHYNDHPLPETYVEMIAHAFGSNADLYQDVLGIDRTASPRAVRIAYFQRGREVLSERQEQGASHARATSATISGQISDLARLRFQAVSMAYEIISNPAWLDAYERCRLITEDDDDEDDEDDDSNEEEADTRDVLSDPDISSTKSLASMSALRRSSSSHSLRSRRNSNSTGVRWNEEVEELVFNLDPEEKKRRRKAEKKKAKKKKKKHKKRIAVETDIDLETHLEQLDKEAEQNFVHDFLDDLEQSIEQMLSTSFGGEDEKLDDDYEDNYDEEEEEDEAVVPKQLFKREKEPLPEEFKTPTQATKPRREVPNAPKKKRVSRRLDASDIEDDEFEMYKHHRQRRVPKTRSFEDKDSSFDRRQEQDEDARDGSQPFDVVQHYSSDKDDNDDEDGSYVSFQGITDPSCAPIRASHSYDAPHRKRRSDAASTKSAPARSPTRGKSAWHASPHSPKKAATMENSFLSSASPTDRNISVRNDLMFASPDGEQALVGLPPTLQEQAQSFTPLSPRFNPKQPQRLLRARSSKESKRLFQAPMDISVSKKYEMQCLDDGGSAAFSVDDSVSTLSASVVQRHINRDLTNSRYKQGLQRDKAEQERLKRATEEKRNGNTTTAATSNMDRLYNSMDAVLQGTMSGGDTTTAPSTPANRSKSFKDANTESLEIPPTTSSNVDFTSKFCFGLCGDEELDEIARAAATAQGSPDDPSFTAFLMVYLNAMATDLARLGHSIQENISGFDFVHSMEIEEKDLDGMLMILESEMEEVPDNIAKTLSQEFLPSSSSYPHETSAPDVVPAHSM